MAAVVAVAASTPAVTALISSILFAPQLIILKRKANEPVVWQ